MDRNSPDDRREFQPMVQRLLTNASHFDNHALPEDGLRTLETIKVAPVQPGAASLLHSRWQNHGAVERLTRSECTALARAGFRIKRNEDGGFWSWWREKRLRHMWLKINECGWNVTSAPVMNDGVRWTLIGSFSEPTLPYFAGYHVTVQDMVREGLTTALFGIRENVPSDVLNQQFFEIVRELCDEAIQTLELEGDWANAILSHGGTKA